MGYEIKMIVGKTALSGSPEYAQDKSKPFDDGSGFEWQRDERGNPVPTGRTMHWFQEMAMVDLCKLGYQDDALNRLIADSHKKAKTDPLNVHYFFGSDGNTQITEDRYGSGMTPVPIADVLAAMEKYADYYRRTRWALALLRSMEEDAEGLEVLFFGY